MIKIEVKSNIMVVTITGDLDHHNAEYIRKKIDHEMLQQSVRGLVFDFSKLTFMDSSGIGVVMGRYKQVRCQNGETAMVQCPERVRKIFEMSGIFKIMKEFPDTKTAIRALSKESMHNAANQ